ncbi:hypothetical protein [Caulobacter segnis]|uniref:hypothetical protein n=1 Tax=Caulobacter segnis TaxID=88688 RepID=UPI00269E040C|nr:hypothetical protein [Caulobacter segnis]
MSEPTEDKSQDALAEASTDRQDQGDIAADDAGATAIGHRVQAALEEDDDVHCTD